MLVDAATLRLFQPVLDRAQPTRDGHGPAPDHHDHERVRREDVPVRAQALLGSMLFKGEDVSRQAALGLFWLIVATDARGFPG